jgi:hypothetical protein
MIGPVCQMDPFTLSHELRSRDNICIDSAGSLSDGGTLRYESHAGL